MGSAETSSSGAQAPTGPNTTKSIYHRLLIESPVEKVYGALTTQEGLAGWWTPDSTAKPEIGSIARFAFGPDYFKEMEDAASTYQNAASIDGDVMSTYPDTVSL